jgi:hypothetical protein
MNGPNRCDCRVPECPGVDFVHRYGDPFGIFVGGGDFIFLDEVKQCMEKILAPVCHPLWCAFTGF